MHLLTHSMQRGLQRSERQRLLLELVSGSQISRQDQLVRLLRRNGYSVTQASVSRDLEELGITKRSGIYRTPLLEPNKPSFGTVSFVSAGKNLIVAKCSSGMASAFAVRIDAVNFPWIAGTIAGDDTVFIAVMKNSNDRSLIAVLEKYFNG